MRDQRPPSTARQAEIHKAEGQLQLSSDFSADLARQDNKRLEVVQENERTVDVVQYLFEQSMREIVEALKTFMWP